MLCVNMGTLVSALWYFRDFLQASGKNSVEEFIEIVNFSFNSTNSIRQEGEKSYVFLYMLNYDHSKWVLFLK